MKPIFCLMGPTASGKTDLAIRLVQQYPFEIISVDSAMVYKSMHIGTAKPTIEEQKKAPHKLINICDPADPYSAGKFRLHAITAIDDIHQKNKIPLLVGGAMLYFHVLQKGTAILPQSNPYTRKYLMQKMEQEGLESLYEMLKLVDPKKANQIHINDSQRILRALEVYQLTGRTLSELQTIHATEPLDYHFINLSIEPEDLLNLHQIIDQRLKKMLVLGFLDEVKKLKDRGDLSLELPSMRTVGYRQAWGYLEGLCSYETFVEKTKAATRQLAKRQLTWLRRWPNLTRFYFEDSQHYSKIIKLVKMHN